MGRSTFSFKGIEDALEEIAKHLVPAGPYFKDDKPSFGELVMSGVEEKIYGTLPNREVERAPLSWEFATKGELTSDGYVVYAAFKQKAYVGAGEFRESDGFLPDYTVGDVLQWFASKGIQLYPMPKKGLDRFKAYTHKYVFHIKPQV